MYAYHAYVLISIYYMRHSREECKGRGNTYSPHALENIQDNAIVLVDVLVLVPVRAGRSGIVADC